MARRLVTPPPAPMEPAASGALAAGPAALQATPEPESRHRGPVRRAPPTSTAGTRSWPVFRSRTDRSPGVNARPATSSLVSSTRTVVPRDSPASPTVRTGAAKLVPSAAWRPRPSLPVSVMTSAQRDGAAPTSARAGGSKTQPRRAAIPPSCGFRARLSCARARGARAAGSVFVQRRPWFALMVLSAALWAGACSSPLAGGGGTGTGGAGGRTDGAVDVSGGPSLALVGQSCATDADCGNLFLTCIQNQCAIRYDRPCTVDSDCGPAGYICTPACPDAGSASCSACLGGTSCNHCVVNAPSTPCTSDDQCLTGWSCYDLCNTGNPATLACRPPFLISLCVN